MPVKACLFAFPAMYLVSVPRQRDEATTAERCCAAEHLSELVAARSRQADVEHHDVRVEDHCLLEGLESIKGGTDVMAATSQNDRQRFHGVHMLVD